LADVQALREIARVKRGDSRDNEQYDQSMPEYRERAVSGKSRQGAFKHSRPAFRLRDVE
jgi:hypothetical protein